MGAFQKRLNDLLNEVSKTKIKSEKKQVEYEITGLITEAFIERRDYPFILTTIEKTFNKRRKEPSEYCFF